MARHRNIRNAKSYDYDDDYDYYGQSYEDDYGVSPGTMAEYSYSRSSGKGVDLSSYIPSEETVKEEEWEEDKASHEKTNQLNPLSFQSKGVDSKTLAACIEAITDVVGDNYSESDIRNAALRCNSDLEKSIDLLLTPSDYTTTTSNPRILSEAFSKGTNGIVQNTVSMPQRTNNRGRRGRFQQKNNDVVVLTTTNQSPSSTVVSTKNEIATPTKIAMSSNTPVKKGFQISTKKSHLKENFSISDSANVKVKEPVKHETDFSIKLTKPTVSTPMRKESVDGSTSTGKQQKHTIDYKKEYENRIRSEKQQLSMVVIGHVDAGKSTMMGHLLFEKGVVSKRLIHKYEQESRKLGKSSFAYAWVLDETGEERARGVTMDIARNNFETENRIISLMDAPGHRDFIPNMITGASQADVAVLVVGSSTGEFEAGFGVGGQTREHALLVRSLGVAQLAVAVNKLDTVNWSKQRFDEIVQKLRHFLKQAGFRDSDVTYVPVSGLLGENLVTVAKEPLLCSWYKGPCLLQVIDKFRSPPRPVEYPFRFCINDVFRGQGSGIYLGGKVESGGVCPSTKVIVMPSGEKGLIKSVESTDDKGRIDFALAGDHATLILNGVDMLKITKGSVVCDIDKPIRVVTRLQARIIIFNIEVPITRGFPVELHYKAVSEPGIIKRLLSQLNKSTGDVLVKKPRAVLKGQNALVEIEVLRPICLEEYSNLKELGRFTLRYAGSTIAACVVTKLL